MICRVGIGKAFTGQYINLLQYLSDVCQPFKFSKDRFLRGVKVGWGETF